MKKIFSAFFALCFGVSLLGSPFAKNEPVEIVTPVDRALQQCWLSQNLTMPKKASDSVIVRRLYLDLTGKIPTIEEAKSYVNDTSPDKYKLLVDKLLSSENFYDYWTMRWCDTLRVKSEFPINLWPNAVYSYQRRIRKFLSENEPYDQFVKALLTSQGSNFRVAESNFYRATGDRSATGLAKVTALSWLGERMEKWSQAKQAKFIKLFEDIKFKSTHEWKEEVVFFNTPQTGEIIAQNILKNENFAPALVNRVWGWLFSKGIVNLPDDMRADNPAVNPELLALLAKDFKGSNYNFRELCRQIVNSAAYQSASTGSANRERYFASYPIRRLEAEVLADAIAQITNVPFKYSSVIPEPFTYLPEKDGAVNIADGSISDSFLILFGRPMRDFGVWEERLNSINAKQRLQLFNSGGLYNKLQKIQKAPQFKRANISQKMDLFSWLFLSRPATAEEKKNLNLKYQQLKTSKERWLFMIDLCWIYLNSKEFLHQH